MEQVRLWHQVALHITALTRRKAEETDRDSIFKKIKALFDGKEAREIYNLIPAAVAALVEEGKTNYTEQDVSTKAYDLFRDQGFALRQGQSYDADQIFENYTFDMITEVIDTEIAGKKYEWEKKVLEEVMAQYSLRLET